MTVHIIYFVASDSEQVWDDLHGAFPAGLAAPGDLLDEHPPRAPAGPRPQLPSAGALSLAGAPLPPNSTQTLQGRRIGGPRTSPDMYLLSGPLWNVNVFNLTLLYPA